MTHEVREAHDTSVDVQAPHPLRIFPGSQRAWLSLIWGMLATLAGFVLWRDAVDPHGMVVDGLRFWISYRSRLGSLSVLVLCALVFAMIVQANGLRQLVAGLPAVLATHWRKALYNIPNSGRDQKPRNFRRINGCRDFEL